MEPIPCPNQNHRRSNAKVRYCPNCGKVVNEKIVMKACSIETHNKERQCMDKYCVDCGLQIIL